MKAGVFIAPRQDDLGAWYDPRDLYEEGKKAVKSAYNAAVDLIDDAARAVLPDAAVDFVEGLDDVVFSTLEKNIYDNLSDPVFWGEIAIVVGGAALCAGTGGAGCGPALLLASEALAISAGTHIAIETLEDLPSKSYDQLRKAFRSHPRANQAIHNIKVRLEARIREEAARAAAIAKRQADLKKYTDEINAKLKDVDLGKWMGKKWKAYAATHFIEARMKGTPGPEAWKRHVLPHIRRAHEKHAEALIAEVGQNWGPTGWTEEMKRKGLATMSQEDRAQALGGGRFFPSRDAVVSDLYDGKMPPEKVKERQIRPAAAKAARYYVEQAHPQVKDERELNRMAGEFVAGGGLQKREKGLAAVRPPVGAPKPKAGQKPAAKPAAVRADASPAQVEAPAKSNTAMVIGLGAAAVAVAFLAMGK